MARYVLPLVFLFALGVGNAVAEQTAQSFIDEYDHESEDTRSTLEMYLLGLANGFGWANAALEDGKKLYCKPDTTGLGDRQALDLLRRHVKANARLKDEQVGMVLLAALREKFPCDKRSGAR